MTEPINPYRLERTFAFRPLRERWFTLLEGRWRPFTRTKSILVRAYHVRCNGGRAHGAERWVRAGVKYVEFPYVATIPEARLIGDTEPFVPDSLYLAHERYVVAERPYGPDVQQLYLKLVEA